mgnify:CR=1 FL=1
MFCPVCGDAVENQAGLIEHTEKVHSKEEMQSFFQQQTPQVQIPTEILRAENFQKHYATNCAVNVTQFDIRIDVLNEKRELPVGERHPLFPVIQFFSEAQVIATPIGAKILHQQLGQAIEMLEKEIGKIEIPR